MSRPSFFKRRYLINRPMQFKYALMVGMALMVMLLLVQYHTYWTIQSIYPYVFSSYLGRQIKSLQYWMLINGAVYALGAAVLSIFISHKIAGPVYRLEKAIREILDSNDSSRRITLREGDEFHSLAAQINLLLERLAQARKK